MSKNHKHNKKSHKSSESDPAAQFIRMAYSKGNAKLAGGIGYARTQTEIAHFPSIIPTLLKNPIFKSRIARPDFPKSLVDFTLQSRLLQDTPEKEYAWTAVLLENYIEELTKFVYLRDGFEEAVLDNRLEAAESILKEVEEQLGFSIWLITRKIQLLQLTSGIESQKEFLADLLANSGANVVVKLLSYYISLRNEENVSKISFEGQVASLTQNHVLQDYANYHLLPDRIDEIEAPFVPIYYEQTQPIVDRYQVVRAMTLLKISKTRSLSDPATRRFIEKLSVTGDSALAQLRCVVAGEIHPSWPTEIAVIDEYTKGNYGSLSVLPTSEFEIVSRGLLHSDKIWDVEEHGIRSKIIKSACSIIQPVRNVSAARSQLEKIQLSIGNSALSPVIAAFAARDQDYVFAKTYSHIETYAALCGSFANPRNARILLQIKECQALENILISNFPQSPSLALDKIMRDVASDEQMLDDISLPVHRKLMYRGHLAMMRGRPEDAIKFYSEAGHAVTSYKPIVDSYLCKAIYQSGDIAGAVRLVAEVCLVNAEAFRLFPIEEIVNSALDVCYDDFLLELIVVVSVLSRNVSREWERELSDLFERLVGEMGVDRPHQILLLSGIRPDEKIKYILKHVCVPRILDGTTWFEDIEDLEDERINVCRGLLDVDSEHRETYSEEIRLLVRNREISKLLFQVEETLIYVDEEGICGAISDQLKDSYNRFQRLLGSPTLDAQAEKISQLLHRLLKDDQSGDLKIQTAASEREALVNSVLELFVGRFALDPAYGLDTNLSTTIRHGAFEGRVRGPLATEDLLCGYEEGAVSIPARWTTMLEDASQDELDRLSAILNRFTSRIEDAYNLFLDELLRVRGETENLNGLFNFLVPRSERLAFMARLEQATTYEAFVDLLLSLCWSLTDKALINIRSELETKLRNSVNTAFATLIHSAESNLKSGNAKIVIDRAISARTHFQASVNEIASWFRRPNNTLRSPFKLDVAIGVSLKQIEKCYQRIDVDTSEIPDLTIAGEFLDGLVEIIFILFQNAIRHSRLDAPSIGVDAKLNDEGEFILEIRNSVSPEIPTVDLRSDAHDAVERYERDSALRMARVEGGSGLSKAWRILEYDLRRRHTLDLQVENGAFIAVLTLNATGMVSC